MGFVTTDAAVWDENSLLLAGVRFSDVRSASRPTVFVSVLPPLDFTLQRKRTWPHSQLSPTCSFPSVRELFYNVFKLGTLIA